MKVMYESCIGRKHFVCFSMNKFVRAWVAIRGDPNDSTLVLANNVTADDRGFSHAASKNGIVLNSPDIAWVRGAVSDSTRFFEVAKTAKAEHHRLLIAQWDNPNFGTTTFEVEATPCLGPYVIFKQGRGRINRTNMTEFTVLLHYMHIAINTSRKECTPCKIEYKDMDIGRRRRLPGLSVLQLSERN